MRDIRIHAVVTGNDGTSGSSSPTFTKAFTRGKLVTLMGQVATILARAGYNVLFDPKADITEVSSALLNEDIPFSDGEPVVPQLSVDDLVHNPNVVAQREFASLLTGSLVVYFRDFSAAKYTPTGGERTVPWNFSGSKHLYVRSQKGPGAGKLAHEIGHYLHLGHTFTGHDPKTVAEAAQVIHDAVEDGKLSKADGALAFDGDRHTGVLDTPPDPRGGLMGSVNNGDKCGPIGAVEVPVAFHDGTTRTYTLQPDRLNVMSYFQSCATTANARLSPGQILRTNGAIDAGNRKHLKSQLHGRYTAVLRRGTADERFVFAAKYDLFRAKYDVLWGQGWRLYDLANHVYRGQVYYTAVFRRSTAPEIQLYGWSYRAYRRRYDELWEQGWRLRILNNYVVDGKVKYTAVFRKSTAPEIQLYGWSYDSYRRRYDQLWEQGWRLRILNNYVVDGKVKYTAVFRKSTAPEIQLYGWSYRSYRAKYDALWKQGWRLRILNTYRVGSRVRYTAVFHRSRAGELQLYGWKYRDFRKRLEELRGERWRVETLIVY